MGFTNSMKPYSFSNKFINLEAFQYNKKIIGPAKIYKATAKDCSRPEWLMLSFKRSIDHKGWLKSKL